MRERNTPSDAGRPFQPRRPIENSDEWTNLFEALNAKLVKHAECISPQRKGDAEDITQTVWERSMKAGLEPSLSITAYMKKAVVNATIDISRRLDTNNTVYGAFEGGLDTTLASHEAPIEEQAAEHMLTPDSINELLAKIGIKRPEHKSIMWLTYQGLTPTEIAEKLDLQQTYVKKQLFQARSIARRYKGKNPDLEL